MNNTNYNSNYNSNDMNYNETDNNAPNVTSNQNNLDKTRPTFQNEMNNFMSDSDKRILSKCQSESFWFSSLPLMCGVTGYLKYNSLKNLKPLSGFKLFFTAGICFVFGKIIYLPICQKRLIESGSDSLLVQKLKDKKFKEFSRLNKNSGFDKEITDQYKDNEDKYSDFDSELKDQNRNDSFTGKF